MAFIQWLDPAFCGGYWVTQLIEAAGGEPIEGLDGNSFYPVLLGETDKHNQYVYGAHTTRGIIAGSECYPIRSIRTHEFNYHLYVQFGEELYDLENDPEEIVNLAGDPEYAQVKADLRSTLDTWIAENGDDFYSYTVTEMQSTGPVIGRGARPLRWS